MARKEKLAKTNAMRELERGEVAFEAQTYEDDGSNATGYGIHVAEALGEDPDTAYKTLVTVAPSGNHVVCCIPVAFEVDLKKAAAAAGEKSLSMLPMRDLEATTGYIRGGCSPVGMKKSFPTLIDETAQLFDQIGISGGRRGLSLRVSPLELASFLNATFADITREA